MSFIRLSFLSFSLLPPSLSAFVLLRFLSSLHFHLSPSSRSLSVFIPLLSPSPSSLPPSLHFHLSPQMYMLTGTCCLLDPQLVQYTAQFYITQSVWIMRILDKCHQVMAYTSYLIGTLYNGTSLSGHLQLEDTSINRTLSSVPNVTFLYLTTPGLKTPHYSGHFNLAQWCPD